MGGSYKRRPSCETELWGELELLLNLAEPSISLTEGISRVRGILGEEEQLDVQGLLCLEDRLVPLTFEGDRTRGNRLGGDRVHLKEFRKFKLKDAKTRLILASGKGWEQNRAFCPLISGLLKEQTACRGGGYYTAHFSTEKDHGGKG